MPALHFSLGLLRAEKSCAGPALLAEETAWIENYRQMWASRFDELDRIVEELKQKEKPNGRGKK